jgi:hypothetical protein
MRVTTQTGSTGRRGTAALPKRATGVRAPWSLDKPLYRKTGLQRHYPSWLPEYVPSLNGSRGVFESFDLASIGPLLQGGSQGSVLGEEGLLVLEVGFQQPEGLDDGAESPSGSRS